MPASTSSRTNAPREAISASVLPRRTKLTSSEPWNVSKRSVAPPVCAASQPRNSATEFSIAPPASRLRSWPSDGSA
jgi:hypothetical protein